jgi:hypothetical protein
MHQISSQSDKTSSSDEQMKETKCALLLKMCPSSMKMLPLGDGSYGSMEMLSMQAQTNLKLLLKLSRVLLKPS